MIDGNFEKIKPRAHKFIRTCNDWSPTKPDNQSMEERLVDGFVKP